MDRGTGRPVAATAAGRRAPSACHPTSSSRPGTVEDLAGEAEAPWILTVCANGLHSLPGHVLGRRCCASARDRRRARWRLATLSGDDGTAPAALRRKGSTE